MVSLCKNIVFSWSLHWSFLCFNWIVWKGIKSSDLNRPLRLITLFAALSYSHDWSWVFCLVHAYSSLQLSLQQLLDSFLLLFIARLLILKVLSTTLTWRLLGFQSFLVIICLHFWIWNLLHGLNLTFGEL